MPPRLLSWLDIERTQLDDLISWWVQELDNTGRYRDEW
jgi:hypothetical protein